MVCGHTHTKCMVCGHTHRGYALETPLGLKRVTGTNVTGDFSGFENESRGTMRRLVNMEREMRFMKEVLEGIMGKCDALEGKQGNEN